MKASLLLVAMIGLAAGACSPPAPKADVKEVEASVRADYATPRAWTCDDGRSLKVAFLSEPQRLEITFPDGGVVILPAQEAASGARYGDATHDFHSKGDEAIYKSGATQTTCKLSAAG